MKNFQRGKGFGILGQVWYLIVSIPDLCTLTYFYKLSTRDFVIYLICKQQKARACLNVQSRQSLCWSQRRDIDKDSGTTRWSCTGLKQGGDYGEVVSSLSNLALVSVFSTKGEVMMYRMYTVNSKFRPKHLPQGDQTSPYLKAQA